MVVPMRGAQLLKNEVQQGFLVVHQLLHRKVIMVPTKYDTFRTRILSPSCHFVFIEAPVPAHGSSADRPSKDHFVMISRRDSQALSRYDLVCVFC